MHDANRPIHTQANPHPAPARLVLLVDDSAAHRRMLSVQLKRAGYIVAEAASADEALEFSKSQQPDFILSDWVMPGMSGPEFCRTYRKRYRDKYAYFLLLTSKTGAAEVAYGLESGADDFLVKPVASAELLARLRAGERILELQEQQSRTTCELETALDQLRAAQAAIERDLREARQLQQGLLREREVSFGDFDLSFMLRPAGHIGGDLVGHFPINSRKVGVFAIDVAGHGVAAALLTTRLATQLSSSVDQNAALYINELGLFVSRPPAELARYLNHLMLEDLSTDTYFTMLYLELDHVSGEVVFVQAGHPYPLLQTADGEISSIGPGGLPVGAFEAASFTETRLTLKPGDRLLIGSDGITEAMTPAGEMLGEQGLADIMKINSLSYGINFLEAMSWSVSEATNGQRSDDVSAVLIEYRPSAR